MKTEREIRQMTQAVTGAAILQEQAGGPAAERNDVACGSEPTFSSAATRA